MTTELRIEREEASRKGGAFIIANTTNSNPRYLAEMTYHWRDGVMVITHTGVREALRHHGVARKLVQAAVDAARAEGFTIDPLCPYAKATFDKEDTLADVRFSRGG